MHNDPDLITYENIDMTALDMAAMNHIEWGIFNSDNNLVLEITEDATKAWQNLFSWIYQTVSLSDVVKNRTAEYIQMCLLWVYLDGRLGSISHILRLSSWSADVANKVDAVATIYDHPYAIDFTRNASQIQNKVTNTSSTNKSNWIVFINIRYIHALVNDVLNHCEWDYSIEAIKKYLKKVSLLQNITMIILDKDTRSLPHILKPKQIQYI